MNCAWHTADSRASWCGENSRDYRRTRGCREPAVSCDWWECRDRVGLYLLVREEDRRAWDTLISSLGYAPHQISRAFHMYNPKERGEFPVDLMFVDADTFRKLAAENGKCILDETEVCIPKLSHLLALKLHALRPGPSQRFERDMSDVIVLIQVNHVDLAEAEYADILDRYATPAVREEILRRLAGPESAGA